MTRPNTNRQRQHHFAYDGLDRIIHERARLGLLTSLVAHPKGLAFAELKRLCRLTDGNLNRHLQVLQAARLVDISKGFERNRSLTHCVVTPLGRKRYIDYLAVLEQVILDATAAVNAESRVKNVHALTRS